MTGWMWKECNGTVGVVTVVVVAVLVAIRTSTNVIVRKVQCQ
jgi:hypothetical protein